ALPICVRQLERGVSIANLDSLDRRLRESVGHVLELRDSFERLHGHLSLDRTGADHSSPSPGIKTVAAGLSSLAKTFSPRAGRRRCGVKGARSLEVAAHRTEYVHGHTNVAFECSSHGDEHREAAFVWTSRGLLPAERAVACQVRGDEHRDAASARGSRGL